MSKIIVLLGPPGSGKDTQAEIISEKHDMPIISTGSLIRHEIRGKTKIGKEIEVGIANGEFVSDEVIKSILGDRLIEKDAKNGFILDGFPRNMDQAHYLDDEIKKEKKITVFYIKISEDEIKHRLLNRRICSKCDASFHLIYNKPEKEGICDVCGGELITRSDDNEKSIKKRIEIFHERTQPLVDFYKKTGRLVEINGERSIKDIAPFIERNIR